MNITVNVDDVSLDTVVRDYRDDEGHQYTVGDMVADRLVKRITSDGDTWTPFRDAVTAIRDEEIRKAVAPLIAEALSAPRQQTNPWGEPTGPATTLSQIIVEEARKSFTQRASRDSYDRDQRTVVQKMVADAVQSAMAKEIADEVKKARDMVSAEIGTEIATRVAAAVQAGLAKR